LKPGQPVDIEVDAIPGHTFHGHVVSFAPASGSEFSLLPPDNATGNFTKVVQRIPVRIRVDSQADERNLLRPGMSVVVSVNTKGTAAAAGQANAAPASVKAQ
jgi:membrane fusion protein (multidrug efflux system)